MFSLRLKELRENLKLSQQAFANKLGVSQSTVGMWESAKREPDYKTTEAIAKFFNVSVDYLMGYNIEPAEIATARARTKILYNEQNTPVNIIEQQLGTTYATFRSWINGIGDFFNGAAGLIKLSELFNVSIDYLLGRTNEKKTPSGRTDITFDDFTYAMYNESKELTNEDKAALLNMARLLKKRTADETE